MARGAIVRALAKLLRSARGTNDEVDAVKDLAAEAYAEYRALTVVTRGEIINMRAALGSRIVTLREQIPQLEKAARKTPPKTLHAERAKVAAAKVALERSRQELVEVEAKWGRLKRREAMASP